MYTIINAVREIKGEKKEQTMLFGTGKLSNVPPAPISVGSNGAKVMRGSKEHPFAIYFPDPSLGKDDQGRTKNKFFNVNLWDKNAEALEKIGFKGQPVEVVGRIEKQGDQGQYEVLIIERFEVKQYKQRDGAAAGSEASANAGAGAGESTGTNANAGQDTGFEGGQAVGGDDEIPF